MAVYKKGFSGNDKIRGAGVSIEWTPERLSEFARCADDPEYFFSNYIKILNLDSEELVNFKPRKYQVNMIETVRESRFTIAKWGRQSGKTTTAAAMLLWFVIFNSNFPVLILAHKHDKAREILGVVQKMYENLPEWLQHGVVSWAKGSFELENGSLVRTGGTSTSSGRGGTYALLVLDEFAFVPSYIADEFLKSVIPTISSGKTSKLVITSTPKGLNTFYRIWTDSLNGKNEYARVDVNWWDIPGRDEEFKQKTIEAYGLEYWRQEFESAFIGSSRTLISADKLTSIAVEDPIKETENSRVYFDPIPGHSYAITVDVSEGLGEDYSVAMVMDITNLPYRVAAFYRNNLIEPMALPGVVHELATAYNDALVLIEANFGQQIGEILYNEFEYENMVFTTKGKTGPQAKMDKISGGFNPRSRVGLQMNAQSKRIGCSNLKTLVENDQLIINDSLIYDELLRFSVSKKSYAAESGNDDLVMCLVMFAWMADQGYIRDATDVNIRGKLAELNAKRLEDEMLPLGFRLEGGEEEMVYFDVARRPAIELPGEDGEPDKFAGMFDRDVSRGGKSEAELHDDFIKQLFSS